MKSTTSPTQSVPRNLVTSTLVSGIYSCLVRTASHRTAKPVGSHQCRRVQVADDSVILDGPVTVRHDTSLEARLPDGEPTLSASGRLSRAFASTVTAANSADAGSLTVTIMSTAREREEAVGIMADTLLRAEAGAGDHTPRRATADDQNYRACAPRPGCGSGDEG
jgi:hypothetical protein